MTVERDTLIYEGPGDRFQSVVAFDTASDEKRAAILVLPNVLGQKEADNAVAEELAGMGYVAMAVDVFGQGKRTQRGNPDVAKYMNLLNADRALLRDRMLSAIDELRKLPQVDGDRIAAIGYCFGGKCVLDLARSGAPVKGVVSFHGVYDRPDYANVTPIQAKVLVCHGWEDPLCPPDVTVALAKELNDGGADWQIHAYGHTGHAFTDESVPAGSAPGMGYQPNADRRSWKAMIDFLAEVLC